MRVKSTDEPISSLLLPKIILLAKQQQSNDDDDDDKIDCVNCGQFQNWLELAITTCKSVRWIKSVLNDGWKFNIWTIWLFTHTHIYVYTQSSSFSLPLSVQCLSFILPFYSFPFISVAHRVFFVSFRKKVHFTGVITKNSNRLSHVKTQLTNTYQSIQHIHIK